MSDVPAPRRPRVWLGEVESYDTEAVRAAVRRGLEHVRAEVRGNVVGVVDWTDASPTSPAAATRPELVEGALGELLSREEDLFVVLTGRAGEGRCTRRVARAAGARGGFEARGYFELPRLHPGRVTVRPADEARRYRYQLSVGTHTPAGAVPADLPGTARVIDRVPLGWELYHADSVVAFPKLAGAVGGLGVCGAVALLGALPWGPPMDAEVARRRRVDAVEPAWPDLVITDGVEVGWGGARRTQAARPLGLVVVADDALAHDVVLAHLAGRDPWEVDELQVLAERGYGSLSIDDIDVAGDRDLAYSADRLLGFGPPPAPAVDIAPRFEAETGHPLAPTLRVGGAGAEAAAEVVAERIAAAQDDPDAREQLKFWPPTVLRVGSAPAPLDAGVHHLVGDAAVSAFRRDHPEAWTVLRLPDALARRWDGPTELIRWRRSDGRAGFALALEGPAPTHRALQRSLFLGSLGRIRSPWDTPGRRLLHLVEGWGSRLRRAFRNRDGVPVVHARKIPRLKGRPWRRRWADPPALELRPDLLVSSTVARLPEPEPEP